MQTLPKHIWDTLSRIDVSDHVETKQGLTYLSWAWAWGVMCEHFPDTTYTFTSETFPDETVEYTCFVTVKHCGQVHTQMMWLPAMDHRNKAVKSPDAFVRNSCKMRCLVKCLAMMGLGHYIYAGEDLPQGQAPEAINEHERELIDRMIEETGVDVAKFCKAYGIARTADLPKAAFDKALAQLESKLSKGNDNG